MIDEKDRRGLLLVARRAIEEALRGGKHKPSVPEAGPLAESRGAFVTLTRAGRLRGCIGLVVADRPLVEVVAEMAAAAALHDYRFSPVREEEIPELRIEISALTPLEPVRGPEEVRVGRDGLLIRKGASSGLLLPQVAEREGWSPDRFLDETCRKAGLPAGAWREEGASVERFAAEVWGEEE
ncbi:MAG: AmmeMemoRadiSam system protein A [Candidatus Eisenbacteria bacterium]|nr:AmmeMemoRadiSam system protein A [Candidatus Eisenbacteria bacterium]